MTDTAPASDPGPPSEAPVEAPAPEVVSEEPSSEPTPASEPAADPDHPVFAVPPAEPTVHTGDDDDPDREGRKLA